MMVSKFSTSANKKVNFEKEETAVSLKYWNWRFRIFFDDNILSEVNDFVDRLSTEEKRIYKEIISFYMSFFSIQILLDNIIECPERSDKYIAKAWESRDKIIFLPVSLVGYYQTVILDMQLSDTLKSKLYNLIEYAKTAKSKYKDYLALCQKIYGPQFNQMMSIVHEEGIENIKVPRGTCVKNKVLEEFKTIYDKNIHNEVFIKRYGEPRLHDFDVSILSGQSYGEWWDREISPKGKDILILYENEDSQYFNDLKYTLYHETYPGHGQFYRTIHNRKAHHFDHGAMSIIEGWATYVEWHSEDSGYTHAIRKNALYFLNLLSTHQIEDIDEVLIHSKIEQGYSREADLQSVVNATQNIGYSECYYYYGALWLEIFMNKKQIEPKDFLTFLSNHNMVDGFATWCTVV